MLATTGPQAVKQAVSERVWTESTPKGGCVRIQRATDLGPGGSCFNARTLLQGNAWNISGDEKNGFRLFALVSDGVTEATVTFADKTSRQVPVVNNSVYVESPVNFSGYNYAVDGIKRQVSAAGFDG